jgi:hypothetical protein
MKQVQSVYVRLRQERVVSILNVDVSDLAFKVVKNGFAFYGSTKGVFN